jgi:hypothetical protein
MRTVIGSWLLAIAACSSGPAPGADTTTDPPSVQSSGGEVGRQEPVELASGPASVLVRALVNGQIVAAHVRVLDADGGGAVDGVAGTALSLRAGAHRAEITIDDAAVLADRPTQVAELFIAPGKETAIDATFPWSKVQLNVVAQGRSLHGATVKLIRNGAAVAEMKSGAQPAMISPGKYEADVLVNGATIRVKGLLFPENGAQTVPVRVQF